MSLQRCGNQVLGIASCSYRSGLIEIVIFSYGFPIISIMTVIAFYCSENMVNAITISITISFDVALP